MAAEAPALQTCCARCGRPFVSTREMVRVGEDSYVHSRGCEGPGPAPGSAPRGALLAALGGTAGFLSGLWLFAMAGWLWPAALVVAVVGCWLAVWSMARAGGTGR